jgi:hypothetical protein
MHHMTDKKHILLVRIVEYGKSTLDFVDHNVLTNEISFAY